MTFRLSVLDQSPVPEGGTRAGALRATVELAVAADTLGYSRYWLAEHHDSPGFAGTAPEVLAGIVLANTRRLRVGSGGVLLPRYHPVKVAEVFGVLDGLYPGQVDLGVGRAGGPAQDYPHRIATLLAELGTAGPPVWILGGSTSSARLAADLGTAYCYAHFLNPVSGVDSMSVYHQDAVDRPSSIAVRVFTADTDSAAAELAARFLLWRSRKDLGQDLPIPSPDTVRGHEWTEAELARAQAHRAGIVVGSPDRVRAELTELAQQHGVTEIVINTLTHDPIDRLRSYQLLAEAMRAAPAAAL